MTNEPKKLQKPSTKDSPGLAAAGQKRSKADVAAESIELPPGVQLIAAADGVNVQAIAFSPDGRQLAAGNAELGKGAGQEVVYLFDAATGQALKPLGAQRQLFRRHQGAITALAFAPDSRGLATGDDTGGINLWGLPAGKPRWWGCRVQGARILSLAFLAQGELLAVGSRRRLAEPMIGWTHFVEELGVRSARTGKLKRPLRPEYVTALAAPEAGAQFASSGDGVIRLWKLETHAPWSQLKGHESPVKSLAFSRAGQLLASGGDDRATYVWLPATGEILATLRFSEGVKAVAISPHGKYVASLAHRLVLWDATTRSVKLSIAGVSNYQALAFSPDGKTLAVGGPQGIRIWEIAGLKG